MKRIPWKLFLTKGFFYNIVFFILIFSILYANSLHEKYPDEFDNILGGKLILQGYFPYSGFFSHHGPIAYFLSALLSLFSGGSFVGFRFIYSIFLSSFLFGSYWYLKQSIGFSQTKIYLFFLPLFGIAMTYFWGHMFLADSLAALFLLPVISLLFFKTVYEKKLTINDLWLISICCFAALMSALTFIYAIAFIYAFVFYSYVKDHNYLTHISQVGKCMLIFAAPFILFFFSLLITGSVKDYYYQAIEYNQKYYIYNYPYAPGSTTINPVRFAIVMVHNFYNNFFPLLFQVKDFNFATPFNITLAISVTSLLIYFLIKRHYALFFTFLIFLIFANARSSPLDSKETDYQSAVYIVTALLSMCFVLHRFWEELKNVGIAFTHKIVISFLFILVGVYAFFMVGFLFNKFFDRVFDKYMGTAPLIYDRPQLAPLLNKIVRKNEFVWVGPYEYEELLYINAQPASKYHVLLPGVGKSEKMQQELIADLERTKPDIIWFDKAFSILGSNPQDYATDFIQFVGDNYETLGTYRNNGVRYISAIPYDREIDIENKWYIRRDVMQTMVQRLLAENLIQEENVK